MVFTPFCFSVVFGNFCYQIDMKRHMRHSVTNLIEIEISKLVPLKKRKTVHVHSNDAYRRK